MPQVRNGGELCEGLSADSPGSGFEDLLSLSSGWTFEGQLSTTCCRTGAGSSTGHFEDSRRRSGWSGAPRAQGRAYQLAAEEVRAVPDADAGMFLS